jgi:hypothetical protein
MRSIVRLLLLGSLVASSGCAVTGGSGNAPPAMPAARVSLRPEYRLFYDALVDHGDWVLIEPFGYVFRPRVDFVSWRPYSNGFWVPSDVYGWVWVSAESFGWATEHYGRWLWDEYQGWVWIPGLDWGPAWVSWQLGDRWVGWGALAPSGGIAGHGRPAGGFVYAPVQSLGTPTVSASLVTREHLGDAAETLAPVRNVVERDGVRVELGPPIEQIERRIGLALPRARLDDVLAAGRARPPGAVRGAEAAADSAGALPSPEALRRAGVDAAREIQRLAGQRVPAPARVPVIRPFAPRAPDEPGGRPRPEPRGAAPDTARGGRR